MTTRTQQRLALAILVVTIGIVTVGLALWVATRGPVDSPGYVIVIATVAISYVAAGALLIDRLPENRIGWVVIGIGAFQGLNIITAGYGTFAFARDDAPLALGGLFGWASLWTWIPSISLLVTFLPLLFPDGHPPSPRWRWVVWLAASGIIASLAGFMVGTWSFRHGGFRESSASPGGPGGLLAALGILMVGVAGVASIAALVVRYRRSRGDERQQLRWFLFAAGFVLIAVVIGFTPFDTGYVGIAIGFVLLPVSIVIAMTKYHLYDIDFVIKKAAVAVLVTLLIGVPALAVLAIASQVLLWNRTGKALTLAGGILLGMLVLPLIRSARRVADRIVYGHRASSYEVLAAFSGRVADTYATEDVLERMAEVLRAGTGSAGATVWLRDGPALRASAVAGTDQPDHVVHDVVELSGDRSVFGVGVQHQGEPLGALSVTMTPDDPLDPGRERLVRDLASQAGLVLRNVGLIEDLRASRQRLVAAQDEERRKIERNLHDGAQQQLVALAVKQRLAASLVGRDDDRARSMLDELQTETSEALDALRDLARGIYPPLLADKGLAEALRAQARKATVTVSIDADGIGRFPQEIEATVYFCALEALNNVAKYAGATTATIRLANGNGRLRFEVHDDGHGFDPGETSYGTGLQGMADRLAAVGGSLSVDSAPERGTTVAGSVPVARGAVG
jgi:signal transduction histidine kinase